MNAKNPKGFRPHTLTSLVKKPVHFFAFGLGSGLIHPAPGTWGTLAATILYYPLSYLLTDGKSARLYKKMIDEHQTALQVLAFSDAQEDYGTYIMGALPMDGVSLDTLGKEIDEEIEKLQTELISEREYEKLQNQIEAQFVSQHNNMEGIALSLADHYTFYNDTHFINKAIDQYRSITREEIRDAARKYLDKNKRLELDYLPTN